MVLQLFSSFFAVSFSACHCCPPLHLSFFPCIMSLIDCGTDVIEVLRRTRKKEGAIWVDGARGVGAVGSKKPAFRRRRRWSRSKGGRYGWSRNRVIRTTFFEAAVTRRDGPSTCRWLDGSAVAVSVFRFRGPRAPSAFRADNDGAGQLATLRNCE